MSTATVEIALGLQEEFLRGQTKGSGIFSTALFEDLSNNHSSHSAARRFPRRPISRRSSPPFNIKHSATSPLTHYA